MPNSNFIRDLKLSIYSFNWKVIRRISYILIILGAVGLLLYTPQIIDYYKYRKYKGKTTGNLEYWKPESQIQSDMLGKVTTNTRYIIEYNYFVGAKKYFHKLKLKKNRVSKEELIKLKASQKKLNIIYNTENPKENTIVFDNE